MKSVLPGLYHFRGSEAFANLETRVMKIRTRFLLRYASPGICMECGDCGIAGYAHRPVICMLR